MIIPIVIGVGAFAVGIVVAWPTFFPLRAAGSGLPVSRSGEQLISQPYSNPRVNAQDLITDINTQAGGGSVTIQVARYLRSLDVFAGYTGLSGTPFPLQAPEAYLVGVNADVPQYAITGGDIPQFSITFYAQGTVAPGEQFPSRTGINMISIPDKNVPVPLANAGSLLSLCGPNAVAACRYLQQADFWECYTGASGLNFPLVPGEGYMVQVSNNTTFVMP
jgi:hypothetical protein